MNLMYLLGAGRVMPLLKYTALFLLAFNFTIAERVCESAEEIRQNPSFAERTIELQFKGISGVQSQLIVPRPGWKFDLAKRDGFTFITGAHHGDSTCLGYEQLSEGLLFFKAELRPYYDSETSRVFGFPQHQSLTCRLRVHESEHLPYEQ